MFTEFVCFCTLAYPVEALALVQEQAVIERALEAVRMSATLLPSTEEAVVLGCTWGRRAERILRAATGGVSGPFVI